MELGMIYPQNILINPYAASKNSREKTISIP